MGSLAEGERECIRFGAGSASSEPAWRFNELVVRFPGPQAYLFDDASPSETFRHPIDQLDEHPGEAFIDRIRVELTGYLDLAEAADPLPWRKHGGEDRPDFTKAYSIHMRPWFGRSSGPVS